MNMFNDLPDEALLSDDFYAFTKQIAELKEELNEVTAAFKTQYANYTIKKKGLEEKAAQLAEEQRKKWLAEGKDNVQS